MRIKELLESVTRSMYHVSKSANQESILHSGLQPRNQEHLNINRVPGIYLFSSLDSAIEWAFWDALHQKQSMDIWEVRLPADYDLEKDSHREMKTWNAYVGYSPISSNLLKVIKTQPVPNLAKEKPPFSN